LVSLGTILDNQLAALRSTFGPAVPISIVVGFGADALIAACPTLTYVRNDRWKHTDTAYGLGCALRGRPTTGVLWLPGDVVCDASVLEALGGPMAPASRAPVRRGGLPSVPIRAPRAAPANTIGGCLPQLIKPRCRS
jgi:choline kinase